jgi:hypothetical protein
LRSSPVSAGKVKMAAFSLVPHPDFPAPAIRLSVEVTRYGAGLGLTYYVSGAIEDVAFPPAKAAARADNLWHHTCFEAFLRPLDGPAYLEFNFAPSTAWAIYAFDRYRENMRVPPAIMPPRIDVRAIGSTFEIGAVASTEMTGAAALGLSAVIEAKDGSKSYWALAHGLGAPDFHNPDCFTARLPAPEGA